MTIQLTTVVLDAEDVGSVSAFWAGLLGGTVERTTPTWHTVRVDGQPALVAQGVSGHVPPDWPDGAPQQVHLDFEVDDIATAHASAVRLGARVLRPAEGPRLDAPIGFQVYADPAGHPFCLCWGQELVE